MSGQIEPALTGEEWRLMLGREDGWEWMSLKDPDSRADAVEERINGASEPNFAGAAALALHDQPFGFTWEDVDLLRGVAGDYEGRGGLFPAGVALNGLGARIAALLPPRGS
jgi:hypothetical protein